MVASNSYSANIRKIFNTISIYLHYSILIKYIMKDLYYPLRKVKWSIGDTDFAFSVGQQLRYFKIAEIQEITIGEEYYINIFVSNDDDTATLWKQIPRRFCVLEFDLSIIK